MKSFSILGNRKGFTLVELAIVLVIIGVILGAVLQGRTMIDSAKQKRVVSQEKEVVAAVYTYQDKYQFFPGDDNTAAARWPASANGTGDGIIAGGVVASVACVAGNTTETCLTWDHMRLAGILSGTGSASPRNSYAGAVGIGNFIAPGDAVARNWVVFSQLPGDAAQTIDTQNDDGVWNTGSVRSNAVYTTAAVNQYWRLN